MNTTKSSFLVIANGEPPSFALLQSLSKKHDQLIAVDAGLYTCLQCGFEPHLIIGDFDSVSEETLKQYAHIPQIQTPNQDKSDLEKTVDHLVKLQPQKITVCGALGKRLDHTLNNICLLSCHPNILQFETDTETCFAPSRSTVLNCEKGQTLSLIPISSEVRGVVTHGLKWELKGDILNKHLVSISNICLQNIIEISFETGDLIVCLNREES